MLDFKKKACFNAFMLKTDAIQVLGGSVSSAAKAVGVSPQAISLWPDVLTDAIRDRVQAALYRENRQAQHDPIAAQPCADTEPEPITAG